MPRARTARPRLRARPSRRRSSRPRSRARPGSCSTSRAGRTSGLFEVNEAAEVVTGAADQNANVIFGAVIDDKLGDQVRVTVIATGFGPQRSAAGARRASSCPSRAAEGFEVSDDVLDVPSFLATTELEVSGLTPRR